MLVSMMGLWFGLLVQRAEAHGSLIYPLPRNGVDRNVEPFKSGGWPKGHYTCSCTNGTSDCIPGQSCLWFNQGGYLPPPSVSQRHQKQYLLICWLLQGARSAATALGMGQ